MSAYALKQPHPDGSEWIQEFDSRDEAVSYQAHNGGILVHSQPIPGEPGLWWVEVNRHHLADAGPDAFRVAPPRYLRGDPEDDWRDR